LRGFLIDATTDRQFAGMLLDTIRGRRRLNSGGEIRGNLTRALRYAIPPATSALEPSNIRAEQSNSSITFDEELILKLYRHVETGVNPDLEIGQFLTNSAYEHTPPIIGWLDYRAPNGDAATLGVLHKYVPNEGDVWQYTSDALQRYYERTAALPPEEEVSGLMNAARLVALIDEGPSELTHDLMDSYLEDARLLGERTAELHMALSRGTTPAFMPEPFNLLYQRSVYQRMRGLSGRVLPTLRRKIPSLPEDVRPFADAVAHAEPEIVRRFRMLIDRKVGGVRTRVHGDLHLGQVLHTGRDYSFIDFEGEPARTLSERRLKRSPLIDVAGMLRSFHYAAYATLQQELVSGLVRPEDAANLDRWARYWYLWASAYYLKGYLTAAEGTNILPRETADVQMLIDAFLLEKAIYEVGYELNNRPDWLSIPLRGVLQLIGEGS